MYKIFLALHLVFAVFAIGPLVQAATTAGRAVRLRDSAALSGAARMLQLYSYGSVLVVVFGFAVMSSTAPSTGRSTAEIGDLWIWLSLVLWVVALALVLAILVPTLRKAADLAGRQESVATLTGRVAATGGVVGVLFAAIVFLMVYRPGS